MFSISHETLLSYPCPTISLSISLSPGRSYWNQSYIWRHCQKQQDGRTNAHKVVMNIVYVMRIPQLAFPYCCMDSLLVKLHSKLFWFKGILRFPRFFENFFKIVMTLFHEICCNFLELLGLANFLEINFWYCVDGFSRNA